MTFGRLLSIITIKLLLDYTDEIGYTALGKSQNMVLLEEMIEVRKIHSKFQTSHLPWSAARFFYLWWVSRFLSAETRCWKAFWSFLPNLHASKKHDFFCYNTNMCRRFFFILKCKCFWRVSQHLQLKSAFNRQNKPYVLRWEFWRSLKTLAYIDIKSG